MLGRILCSIVFTALLAAPTWAQDRDLMPQYQDLHVLGGVASGEEHQPAEQPDHEQIDEAEEHEC